MARQVLENGVILPAEYSDDWYDDMTSNLTKLDDVIGSDSEKLSSADVGAAALSNNYNDLDNLPTIPTVNDATLTIQKNGVDVQTFTANASSNVTANITVPTKTSDLTNDSNFVDTSNSAVASGITSAKVTSYDSHVADTDIHVTAADKNKWNNGVSQSYVLRYSSSSVTDNSTIAYSTLDNTDNIKSGDKVIDVDGKIFSIVSVDTANSTVTVGSALIDLALDANVVHTSGNETKSGELTLSDTLNSSDIVPIANNSYSSGSSNNQWNNLYAKNYYYNGVAWGLDKENTWSQNQIISSSLNRTFAIKNTTYTLGEATPSANKIIGSLAFKDNNNENAAYIDIGHYQSGDIFSRWLARYKFQGGVKSTTGYTVNAAVDLGLTNSGEAFLRPYSNNFIALGDSTHKWKTFNNLEPSSLSLPDLSNGIDISSYITDLTGNPNAYSPPANGYIAIRSTTANVLGIVENTTGMGSYSRGSNQVLAVNLPVVKNSSITIYAVCSSLSQAKFIPCQGNV